MIQKHKPLTAFYHTCAFGSHCMVLLGCHQEWILGIFHGMQHRRRHGWQHAARLAYAIHYLSDAAVPTSALCGARTWLWQGVWQNVCKGFDMHTTRTSMFLPSHVWLPTCLLRLSLNDITV